jgi:hypothetical protein
MSGLLAGIGHVAHATADLNRLAAFYADVRSASGCWSAARRTP